jgi:hypothetical protein
LFLKDDYKRQADPYHGGTETRKTARIGREFTRIDQSLLPQIRRIKAEETKTTEGKRHVGKAICFC